jgi:putative tributyrin esterase
VPDGVKHTQETLAVQSRVLHRNLPTTLLIPAGRPPKAVLYLLHGGHSHHAEWTEKLDLAAMASAWPVALALPEGGFSLWIRGNNGEDFAHYAAFEVVEAVESRLGLAGNTKRAVAGISMGGFGAAHLGLSHPERFQAVASLSGAWGMTWWNVGRAAGSPFLAALGPIGSSTRAEVDPWQTLERAVAAVGAAKLPPLWLSTGTEDDGEVTAAHRAFHQALEAAGAVHLARERPGRHDWAFWAQETPDMLRAVTQLLGLRADAAE